MSFVYDYITHTPDTPRLWRHSARLAGDRLCTQLSHTLGISLGPVRRSYFGQPISSSGHGISRSYTRQYSAVAISDLGIPIGIDIEPWSRSYSKALARWSPASEYARLEHTPQAYSAHWSLKEAFVKALGTGLRVLPIVTEVIITERTPNRWHAQFPAVPILSGTTYFYDDLQLTLSIVTVKTLTEKL